MPTDAELIKTFMRGIFTAISTKSAEPLGVVARRNFAAPGVVRRGPPVFKRRNHSLPASEMHPAITTGRLCRGETNSVENVSEGERQGTSEHRVLQRDADITALTMPAEYALCLTQKS